jgi:hypothetical protein
MPVPFPSSHSDSGLCFVFGFGWPAIVKNLTLSGSFTKSLQLMVGEGKRSFSNLKLQKTYSGL